MQRLQCPQSFQRWFDNELCPRRIEETVRAGGRREAEEVANMMVKMGGDSKVRAWVTNSSEKVTFNVHLNTNFPHSIISVELR